MAIEMNDAGLLYPMTKMNFVVSVDQIDGVAAFNEVTGIEATVDVIEFRQGNAHSLAPVKIPGLVKHGNVTLKMGYTDGNSIKTWIEECVKETRGEIPRRNVTIEMIDIRKGSPSTIQTTTTNQNLSWVLNNAWVTKYTAPDFNAMTSEIAIESMEVAYEMLTIAR